MFTVCLLSGYGKRLEGPGCWVEEDKGHLFCSFCIIGTIEMIEDSGKLQECC